MCPADFENQVAAVLHLVVGVLVMKPALFLLVQVERKTQAGGINPTLADFAQPPYHPWLGQGVCDLCEACCVRDMSKTVSFLCKADAGFARLTGYVFVTFSMTWAGYGGRRQESTVARSSLSGRIDDFAPHPR